MTTETSHNQIREAPRGNPLESVRALSPSLRFEDISPWIDYDRHGHWQRGMRIVKDSGKRSAFIRLESNATLLPKEGGWAILAVDQENQMYEYYFEPDLQNPSIEAKKGWILTILSHRDFGRSSVFLYNNEGSLPDLTVLDDLSGIPKDYLKIVETLGQRRDL